VAAEEDGTVQLYQASLSTREQRELARAERIIVRGLRSFLEVGAALIKIRDKRLYRQQYETFEDYVWRRWELSRPRAYELCAASEVVEDLSAVADIRLLPENERQARPLTRLKEPSQWRRAWQAAVKVAAAESAPRDRTRHGGSSSAVGRQGPHRTGVGRRGTLRLRVAGQNPVGYPATALSVRLSVGRDLWERRFLGELAEAQAVL
jgi:hypothetical protein